MVVTGCQTEHIQNNEKLENPINTTKNEIKQDKATLITANGNAKPVNGHVVNSKNINQNYQKHFEDRFFNIQLARLKNLNPFKISLPKPSLWNNYGTNSNIEGDPINYGVRSNIRNFYGPPDKDKLKTGEFMQGDDFKFLVEPRRKQSCWVRFSLCVGVNFALLGLIAMIVGYVTPQQDVVVGEVQGYIILDSWAASVNNQLILCQLAGLVTLLCGSVVVCCSLMLIACQNAQRREYYVMRSSLLSQRFVEPPLVFDTKQPWGFHCIPLSGSVRGVQPKYYSANF